MNPMDPAGDRAAAEPQAALSAAPLPLLPFDPASAPQALSLSAAAARRDGRLMLHWLLAGALGAIAIPARGETPQRRDELWTRTCLEAFLAIPGAESYRELNLCPSGDWNLYRLDGYRRGLRPDPAIRALPARREQTAAGLRLSVELDLVALLGAEAAAGPLQLGLTAVIAGLPHGAGTADDTPANPSRQPTPDAPSIPISYWALHHPAAEADFHHRGGFVLQLAAASTPAATHPADSDLS